MVNCKAASALTIAALLACAIPTKSIASLIVPVIAQSAPTFEVPDSVAKGTNVRVSSASDSMNAISQVLGNGFDSKYSAQVAVDSKDADAALQDVLNDNADLAAISRPLTAAEAAKGLIAVPVLRKKIAIVVGKDNPFAQSLTGSQFAQIFRGEIKDWSGVGGEAGPIRVLDLPDTSEMRQSLKPYPVFTTAEFKTGDTATQLSEDTTEALAKEIGTDGIGYVLVDQLEGQSDLKAIDLHQTPPSDPRYPFSQPYSFVYAGGASPAVAAFLGYATGADGQTALATADFTGNGIVPTGNGAAENSATDGAVTTAAGDAEGQPPESTASTPKGLVIGGAGSLDADGNLVDTEGNLISPEGYLIDADGNFVDANGVLLADGAEPVPGVGVDITGSINEPVDGVAGTVGEATDGAGSLAANRGRWWWLLLPLAGLALLIWAAGKRGAEEETGYSVNTGGKTDDKIRSSFRGGDMPRPNPEPGLGSVGINGGTVSASRAGQAGSAGMNKVAGDTALAGGTAAAGAGFVSSRMKNKTGDVTMDLDGVKGTSQDNIGGIRGSAQGDLGNLRSTVQSSTDGTRPSVQGDVEGTRTNLRGSTEGKSSPEGGSWLDRAKQRINEASEQAKDAAAEIKNDTTGDK